MFEQLPIPFELWAFGIIVSFALTAIGFLANPRIHVMIMATAFFLAIFAFIPSALIMGYSVNGGSSIIDYYDLVTSSTGITIRQDSSWIRGELINTSSSQLANKEVNCLTTQLSRNGSPDFDTPIIFGVFDSSANMKYQFGTMNVTATTSDIQFFTRCNNIDSYTLVNGDRIGIKWQDGNSTDNIAIRIHNSDPIDGSNTQATAYSGSWVNSSGSDYSLTISHSGQDGNVTPILYQFNESIRLIFVVLSVLILLASIILVAKEN